MRIQQNDGFSFLEALLAVTIIFFIAAYLIPQFPKLERAAKIQKIEMHASEAAHNGIRKVRDYGETNGYVFIDNIQYRWMYQGGEICVTYTFEEETYERCVSKD